MQTLSQNGVFAKVDPIQLPPMQNEPNQAEIDAKQAQVLREAAQERREKPTRFVTVVTDGSFFRWRRQAGPGTAFTSREPFATFADAIEAAKVIARCYGVPALVPA